MSSLDFDVAKSAFSRVFLTEGQARPDHVPEYMACLRIGAVSQSFGETEPIECPSQDVLGEFEEIDDIQGAVERGTTSLIGRYAANLASTMLQIARRRCAMDLSAQFGNCTDPRDPNTFTKMIAMENARISDWATDDLGALSSEENSAVNETSSVSFEKIYEVMPLTFSSRAASLLTNEAVDTIICDQLACAGACGDESTGCEKIYVLIGGILGSPGTPPDVLYSLDGAATWDIDEIDSMAFGNAADAFACVGDYMVVVSNDVGGLEWKLLSDLNAGTPSLWTEVLTGFVGGGEPNDIWSSGRHAYIVGNGGYIYETTDPTTGVTPLSTGDITANDLNAVHALTETFMVAVGDSDSIVWTQDGTLFQLATVTGGGNNLLSIWCKNEREWQVTDDAGNIYFTNTQGATWTLGNAVPGGATALYDITFPTRAIGYVSGHLNNAGRIWRTFDGGNSWVRLPESSGVMPTARAINALASCEFDANFIVGVGEDEVLDDGIVVVGAG